MLHKMIAPCPFWLFLLNLWCWYIHIQWYFSFRFHVTLHTMRLPFEYEINHHNLKILVRKYMFSNDSTELNNIWIIVHWIFLTIYLSPFLKMLNEDNNGRGNEELSWQNCVMQTLYKINKGFRGYFCIQSQQILQKFKKEGKCNQQSIF